MSDYIPGPIELMEMRAKRMIDKHMPASKPEVFLCAACEQWLHESVGIRTSTSDPSVPSICVPCYKRLIAKGNLE